MRLAIAFVFALAATAGSHRGCGKGGAAYDPCAGKTCGEQCRVCAPDDPDCVETMEVKACDLHHHCVSAWDGLCDPAKVGCRGSTCGAVCTIDPACRSATPPCMIPSQIGRCDATGTCIPGTSAPDSCPPWGCAGKACGDSCGYCPPGTDPSNCPVPTFAPLACDAQLQCNTVGTFTCSPQEACQGKPCGAACDTCPACVGPGPAAQYCDATGACAAGVPTCPP